MSLPTYTPGTVQCAGCDLTLDVDPLQLDESERHHGTHDGTAYVHGHQWVKHEDGRWWCPDHNPSEAFQAIRQTRFELVNAETGEPVGFLVPESAESYSFRILADGWAQQDTRDARGRLTSRREGYYHWSEPRPPETQRSRRHRGRR